MTKYDLRMSSKQLTNTLSTGDSLSLDINNLVPDHSTTTIEPGVTK